MRTVIPLLEFGHQNALSSFGEVLRVRRQRSGERGGEFETEIVHDLRIVLINERSDKLDADVFVGSTLDLHVRSRSKKD